MVRLDDQGQTLRRPDLGGHQQHPETTACCSRTARKQPQVEANALSREGMGRFRMPPLPGHSGNNRPTRFGHLHGSRPEDMSGSWLTSSSSYLIPSPKYFNFRETTMNDLSKSEIYDLQQCEVIIERGLATFVEVGTALLKIRDARLYRATYGTFENYCQERWGMTHGRARQLCSAAEVVMNVKSDTNGITPESERVARPLTSLPPDQQREAWSRVTEEYGQPTAAQVKQTVDDMFPRHEPMNGQGKLFEDAPKPQPWSESEYTRKEQVEAGETVTANMRTDHQLIAWAEEQGLYVKIDRHSIWGNPFLLDEDGDRDEVCDSYRRYLDDKPSLQRRYEDLIGKVLGCWCYPERCHGNVLIEQLDSTANEAERVGRHR